jgi:hypothetical protein
MHFVKHMAAAKTRDKNWTEIMRPVHCCCCLHGTRKEQNGQARDAGTGGRWQWGQAAEEPKPGYSIATAGGVIHSFWIKEQEELVCAWWI